MGRRGRLGSVGECRGSVGECRGLGKVLSRAVELLLS